MSVSFLNCTSPRAARLLNRPMFFRLMIFFSSIATPPFSLFVESGARHRPLRGDAASQCFERSTRRRRQTFSVGDVPNGLLHNFCLVLRNVLSVEQVE